MTHSGAVGLGLTGSVDGHLKGAQVCLTEARTTTSMDVIKTDCTIVVHVVSWSICKGNVSDPHSGDAVVWCPFTTLVSEEWVLLTERAQRACRTSFPHKLHTVARSTCVTCTEYQLYKCSLPPVARSMPIGTICMNIFSLQVHWAVSHLLISFFYGFIAFTV